jgi:CTP synthase
MVVEYARNVLGLKSANSSEMDPNTPYPVIDIMPEQRSVEDKGGTMRLGTYPCQLLEGSLAYKAYDQPLVYERHRHRFELNNGYREALEESGLMAAGISPDGKLVEITELAGDFFMMGVQFHPEFLSRPNRPHPLFREFIAAAKDTLREGAQPPLPL